MIKKVSRKKTRKSTIINKTYVCVGVSLPPKMAKQLRQLAKKKMMTFSELARVAIRHYLKESNTITDQRVDPVSAWEIQ